MLLLMSLGFLSSSALISSDASLITTSLSSRRRRRRRRRSSSRCRPPPPPPQCAGGFDEEASQKEVEFDRDRAREALQKLDQQLESLSLQQTQQLPRTKRPPSPSSDPTLEREKITGIRSSEEMPVFDRSYLSYSAVALLILTVLNNLVFNFFIKPSVDGNERASSIKRVPLSEP